MVCFNFSRKLGGFLEKNWEDFRKIIGRIFGFGCKLTRGGVADIISQKA
jgi:hypothetical protein